MSLKLKKIIDPKAQTVIGALIQDVPKFQVQMDKALDNLQIMLAEYYTRVGFMQKLDKVDDPEALVALSREINPVPDDGMVKIAEYIDLHHSKEPDHVKVLLFIEIGKSLVRGCSDYLTECCRQRMQAIARQEALIIKPKRPKIIT